MGKREELKELLSRIQEEILSDREKLKLDFDRAWEEDFSSTGPILAEMQRLVNLHEEFCASREELESLLSLVEEIRALKELTIENLKSLAERMDQFKALRPHDLSDRLRAYIEDRDPSQTILKAIDYESNHEARIVLEAAARLRHRSDHLKVDLGDDASEAKPHGRSDPNEIPFRLLFD